MIEFKMKVTPGATYTLKVGAGATNSLVKSGSLSFDGIFSSQPSYNCTPSEILDSEGNMVAAAIAASSSITFLYNSFFNYGSDLFRAFGRDKYDSAYMFDFLSPFGNTCSFDGLTYMSPGIESSRSAAKRLPSTPENIVLSPAYSNTSVGLTFNYTAPGKPSAGSGSSGVCAMHQSGSTNTCNVNMKSQPGGDGLIKIFAPSLL